MDRFLGGLAVLGLVAASAWSVAAADGPGAGDDAVARGERLYRFYCVNCHGGGGDGHGPTARFLTVKPPDLTRIAVRNGGAFPTERIAEVVDGRRVARGHGDGRMPIWGLAFQDQELDANQEEQVRSRINELVRYLESIQVEKPSR